MERQFLIFVGLAVFAASGSSCIPEWPEEDLPHGSHDAGADRHVTPTCQASGMSLESVTIVSDDNGDRQINKGERIGIDLSILNCTGSSRSGVSATLSSTDAAVTVDSYYRTQGFGTIAAASEADGNGFYYFDVASSATPHDIPFSLEIKAQDGNSWTAQFILPIVATGAAIQFKTAAVVSDDNGDRQINKGERIGIDIALRNSGTSAALGVSATLSSTDAAITVDSYYRTQGFGTIAAAADADGNGFYYFDVASSATPHDIPFSLEIKDQDGNSWTAQFTLPIVATGAAIQFKTATVVSDDNGDRQINKGERIGIDIALRNNGTSAALGVSATLSTTDAAITVDSYYRTQGFGTIAADADADGNGFYYFDVASSATPHNIPFSLEIKDQDGNSWTAQFTLPIVATGAAIQFKTATVVSDNSGDRKANKGERIGIDIVLRNSGTSAALGVSATLSTTDPDVTVDSYYKTTSFGTIAAAADADGNGFYYFNVASSATPHNIPFSLEIKDQDGNSWTAQFTVPIV